MVLIALYLPLIFAKTNLGKSLCFSIFRDSYAKNPRCPHEETESISITSEQAYAKFTARKAHIEINSIRNKGIKINSRYKSEQSSIGVNDNYLASVTYRKRTFPIYIIAFVVFLLLGITFKENCPDIRNTKIIFEQCREIIIYFSTCNRVIGFDCKTINFNFIYE